MCLSPVTLHLKSFKYWCGRPEDIPPPEIAGFGPASFGVQTVACGKCLECLKQASYQWAFRILGECSLRSDNCFITLTYNDENLPQDKSVSRREVQLFMKRLRQELRPLKVRFFACGEYGKRFGRPHYHLIIFGWFPDDCRFLKRDSGVDLYRSSLLEKCWNKGFSSVGKVTFESALYCAKYMNKWQFEQKRADVSPPFIQMSNRPGIGYDCVYDCDLKSDRIYYNGRSVKIPRYYLKVMERDGIDLSEFKFNRKAQGELVERCVSLKERRKKYESIYLKHTLC